MKIFPLSDEKFIHYLNQNLLQPNMPLKVRMADAISGRPGSDKTLRHQTEYHSQPTNQQRPVKKWRLLH
ncbi:hypothetical protein [Marinilabilia salmonicolor]|uniref:hypothetical protein n=1 Tax=Marinilabilia salmonicolor TaxID=989 RepID=UPI00029A4DC3|nr:hypothetical protein [Marinilabilia salmonicolor]